MKIIVDAMGSDKGPAEIIKGSIDAVNEYGVNVILVGKKDIIKNELVNVAKKTSDYDLLESKFNTLSNHAFHRISDEIIQEVGLPLGERVFPVWQEWLNKEIKKRII